MQVIEQLYLHLLLIKVEVHPNIKVLIKEREREIKVEVHSDLEVLIKGREREREVNDILKKL